MPDPSAPDNSRPDPDPATLAMLGFQMAPVGLMVMAHRRVMRVNQAFEGLFGWTEAEVEGQSVRVLYPSDTDYEKTGRRWARRLAAQAWHEDERFMRRRDGATLWMRTRGCTLTPDDPFRLTLWTFDRVPDHVAGTEGLTLRERQVAAHVVRGRTSKEIGQALGISHRTVEVHRAAILRKLGVARVADLVTRLTGGQPDRREAAQARR